MAKLRKVTVDFFFEYVKPEPEVGQIGGWVMTDIESGKNCDIYLSDRTMEELTEKLIK